MSETSVLDRQDNAEAGPPLFGHDVFVSNIEVAIDYDAPAINGAAEKVNQISARAVWYPGIQTLVLPTNPDPHFLEYAASLGREPRIIVPQPRIPGEVSMRHSMDDPAVQAAIAGRSVVSYVPDPRLGNDMSRASSYYWDDPSGVNRFINDKAHFRQIAEGVVEPPEGVLAVGIDEIVAAVQERLAAEGRTFVRHTESGGGFGNRLFNTADGMPDAQTIREKLEGDAPHRWTNGKALVEKFLDLIHSPSVNFSDGSFDYDGLQITHGSDYLGILSPTPEWIWDPADLERIGNGMAHNAAELGYLACASSDLGTVATNEIYGFEINARMTGTRHAIAIGQSLLGNWHDWRNEGHVIKAVDKLELHSAGSFTDLHATLERERLLATPENPHGVVISIPPLGRVAGVVVLGQGYKNVEETYHQVLEVVGDPNGNIHDNPLNFGK